MSGLPFPTPSLTPSTPTDTSSTAPNKQAQPITPTIPSSHPMSIESMLYYDPLETPLMSTNTSFSYAGHAAESGRQVSPPAFTTSPGNYDTALPVATAFFSPHPMFESVLGNGLPETLPTSTNTSISEDDHAAKARYHDSSHIITSPVNNDPASSVDTAQTATDRNKGKSRDPELNDVNHTEAGNTTEEVRRPDVPGLENHHTEWSLIRGEAQRYERYDAAQSLHRLKNPEELPTAVFIPTNLPYPADTETPKFLAAVFILANLPYASDTESQDEEGPPLYAARKIPFRAYNHAGEPVHCSALKGNAVFDLMARFDREDIDCENFNREDLNSDATVSAADDDDDDDATIDLDDATYPTETSPKPPKLSRNTIERLEKEKREWRPVFDHRLAATTGTTRARPFYFSSSVTQAGEPIPPASWSYATESYIRTTGNRDGQHGGGSYTDLFSGNVFRWREAPTTTTIAAALSPAPTLPTAAANPPPPPTITITSPPPPPTTTTTTNPLKRKRKRNPHPAQAIERSSINTQGWIKREGKMHVPAPVSVTEEAATTITWKPNAKGDFERRVDEVVLEVGVKTRTRASTRKAKGVKGRK